MIEKEIVKNNFEWDHCYVVYTDGGEVKLNDLSDNQYFFYSNAILNFKISIILRVPESQGYICILVVICTLTKYIMLKIKC